MVHRGQVVVVTGGACNGSMCGNSTSFNSETKTKKIRGIGWEVRLLEAVEAAKLLRSAFIDKLLFPAPQPTYGKDKFEVEPMGRNPSCWFKTKCRMPSKSSKLSSKSSHVAMCFDLAPGH